MVKRVIIALLGLMALLGGGWLAMNYRDVKNFTAIISSYYAKEMCTCVFVIEQTEPVCHNIVRQYVPVQEVTIDQEKKRVTVTGLFRTNSASYQGPQYGCTLEGSVE